MATGEYSCRSEVVWTWQLPNNKWTRKEKKWKERGNEGILLVVPQTTRLTKKTHLRGFFFFFLGYTHLVLVFLFLFHWFVFSCIFHLVHFFFSFFFSFNYSHLSWILWLVFLLIFYKLQNPPLSFPIIHFNPLT